MTAKEHKSEEKRAKTAIAKNRDSLMDAAMERAKQDIAKQVAAKQQAAYILNLIGKDELTGEAKTVVKQGKIEDNLQQMANEKVKGEKVTLDVTQQYKQLLEQVGRAKQSYGRLKQLDMHPLTTNDFIHQRHHANRSLGSETLYNAFMQDKQKPVSSLNKALTTYMFGNYNRESAKESADEANTNSKNFRKFSPKSEQDPKYTVRLYMLSRHSEDLAGLRDLRQQNNDRICSQATWSNPSAKRYKLCWKELSDPSLYSEYTEMLYDAETDELSIIRPGEFFLKLDFKLGRILQSNYHTPFGDIPMITQTEQLECNMSNPEHGTVQLVYFLSNDNQNGHYVSISLSYRLSQAPLTKEDLQQV